MSEPALRVDARRNIQRILTAALEVLSEDPAASMEQIAAASDVHRTTIYRRFPTREALIDALLARELEESRTMTKAAGEVTPSESALRELCAHAMALAARYGFIAAHLRPSEIGAATADSGFEQLFANYQSAGVMRDDLPAPWLANVFTTLGVAALEVRRQMDLDDTETADLFANTFLEGASPPRHQDRARASRSA